MSCCAADRLGDSHSLFRRLGMLLSRSFEQTWDHGHKTVGQSLERRSDDRSQVGRTVACFCKARGLLSTYFPTQADYHFLAAFASHLTSGAEMAPGNSAN